MCLDSLRSTLRSSAGGSLSASCFCPSLSCPIREGSLSSAFSSIRFCLLSEASPFQSPGWLTKPSQWLFLSKISSIPSAITPNLISNPVLMSAPTPTESPLSWLWPFRFAPFGWFSAWGKDTIKDNFLWRPSFSTLSNMQRLYALPYLLFSTNSGPIKFKLHGCFLQSFLRFTHSFGI